MTREEIKQIVKEEEKGLKQNLQASVDYIISYSEKFANQISESKKFAEEARKEGIPELLARTLVIVEAYMTVSERYMKYVPPQEVKDEAMRIFKLLHESNWRDCEVEEGGSYLLEFDTQDREVTQKALSSIIEKTLEARGIKDDSGKQFGATLFNAYVIDKDNHCTLSVANENPQKYELAGWLERTFEDKE